MRATLIALLLAPLLVFGGTSEFSPSGTFSESFLILPEDVRDAAKAARRVVVFFEQDGCPACLKMARTTFADGAVADRLRSRFVLIAVDIFGARETVWVDGVARSEKELAKFLGVAGTPTVIVLDEQGRPARRFTGYRDAHAFRAILNAAAPQ